VTLSGSVNKNKIEKLLPTLNSKPSGLVEGYPLFARFVRPLISYKDANDNKVIEPGEIVVADSLEYKGSPLPTRQLSAGTTLGFLKNQLRVSTMFDYRGKFQVLNLNGFNSCNKGFCQAVNDPNASLQSQAYLLAAQTYGSTAWWGYYEDGTFWKWRELSLTYDFPAAAVRFTRAAKASVTLSGRNLGKWTKYSGLDPEIQSNAGSSRYIFFPALSGQVFPAEYFTDNFGAPAQARYWILRVNTSF
jgi:hypothetical protein